MRVFRNIATIMRQSRKGSGMSQKEVAGGMLKYKIKCGQMISNIERGQCSLPLEDILMASKILRVDVDSIIDALICDFAETVAISVRKQRMAISDDETSDPVQTIEEMEREVIENAEKMDVSRYLNDFS